MHITVNFLLLISFLWRMIQKKEKFRCRNCGYCCTLLVLLSEGEIDRIKKLGYEENEFVGTDGRGRKRLRMKSYYCYFMGLHKGESFCRIYEARPKICRDFPFFKNHTAECMPPRLFDDGVFGSRKG